MRRAAELALAGAVAVGLHLAGFAALGSSAPAGVESAGDGGGALVSLVASDAAMAAMVAAWERPPAMPQPRAQLSPPAPEATPVLPDAPPPIPALQAPAPLSLPLAEPVPELAPPPPPPAAEVVAMPAPEGATRPLPRPERPTRRDAVAEPAPVPESPVPDRAQQPATPAEAVPAEVAAGQGAKGSAGKDGAAVAATASGAGADRLRSEWGADIRARIERRKSYPRDGDGAAGTVKLRIVVGTDGRLRGVAVATSSGSPALDAAAVRAVERAGRFPRAPEGIAAGEVAFTLPVSFRP